MENRRTHNDILYEERSRHGGDKYSVQQQVRCVCVHACVCTRVCAHVCSCMHACVYAHICVSEMSRHVCVKVCAL